MGQARRRQHGFTLLEVLVALTIFTILVTAIYASLDIGVKSWEAAAGRSDRLEEMQVTERFLRHYLTSSVPLLINGQARARPFFRGDAHSLRFAADMPPHLGHGGLYQIRLGMENAGGRQRLVVVRRLLHSRLTGKPGPGLRDKSVLVDRLQTLNIAYYGTAAGDKKARWHDKWEKQSLLPALVRIRIRSDSAGAWPVVLIRCPIAASRSLPDGPWIAGGDHGDMNSQDAAP